MLRFIERVEQAAKVLATATLTFDQRTRSRQRIELDNGDVAGLFLPRGELLQHGALIRAEGGQVVQIRAAMEAVSTVRVDDPLVLARACYHLGNRHVALQIDTGMLRYQHDHVLDDMLRGFGLEVISERAPFEPEAGAYGGPGTSHHHGHHDGH